MPKFRVTVVEAHVLVYEVEAESEEMAEDIACGGSITPIERDIDNIDVVDVEEING